MKYTKIFMALLMALFMVACSDDDDAINTNQTTLGFENEAIVVKENVGYFNVPIKIAGYRNGNVKVNVVATPVGENGAVEDVNYMITDKSVQLLSENDTTDNATLNIQIKTIDDQEINENRSFTLEITSAEGATITTKTIQITLRDNDAAFYEKFFGKWTLTAIDDEGKPVEKTINISGPSDEEDPDYDNFLYAFAPGLFNVGVALDCNWNFSYSFDPATKKGTLGIVCGEEVSSYADYYYWIWLGDNGVEYTDDDIVAEWELGENDEFPQTIEWDPEARLWLYAIAPSQGWWVRISNIKLTRQ